MKVYNEVTINMSTGEILYEDSFEYNGEVTECKGGGGSQSSVDTAYNARMAAVAESQQDIADAYFAFWEDFQKPFEIEQIATNRNLLPAQEELQKKIIAAQYAAVNPELALTLATAEQQLGRVEGLAKAEGEKGALQTQLIEDVLDPNKINERLSSTAANIEQSFGLAKEASQRDLARQGFNQTRAASMLGNINLEKAKAKASGVTLAGRAIDEQRLNVFDAVKDSNIAATTDIPDIEDIKQRANSVTSNAQGLQGNKGGA